VGGVTVARRKINLQTLVVIPQESAVKYAYDQKVRWQKRQRRLARQEQLASAIRDGVIIMPNCSSLEEQSERYANMVEIDKRLIEMDVRMTEIENRLSEY
jgi:hypothetical protein